MKEFLIQNWRIILEAVLVVAAGVLALIRKKPIKIVDTIRENIATWLPALIDKAEMSGYKGAEKLIYCLDLVYSVLCQKWMTREEFDRDYLEFTKAQIEAILTTPQKKGE